MRWLDVSAAARFCAVLWLTLAPPLLGAAAAAPPDSASGGYDAQAFFPADAGNAFSTVDDNTLFVGFTTQLDDEAVIAFLQPKLEALRWRLSSVTRLPRSKLFLLARSRSGDGMLTLSKEGGTTRVMLSLPQ